MDSDTKQRVNDLFDIMDGISSDIDFEKEALRLNAEISALQSEISELKTALTDLSSQFKAFTADYQHKKQRVKKLHQDMHAVLSELK